MARWAGDRDYGAVCTVVAGCIRLNALIFRNIHRKPRAAPKAKSRREVGRSEREAEGTGAILKGENAAAVGAERALRHCDRVLADNGGRARSTRVHQERTRHRASARVGRETGQSSFGVAEAVPVLVWVTWP